MAHINLQDLAARVQAVVADPQAPVAATGDAALDKALADLAQRRPASTVDAQVLNFWS